MGIIRGILVSLAFFFTSASVAQEPATVVPAPKQIPQEVQYLEMANKLVSFGRQTKSALALVQAVQIYRQLNVVDDSSNDESSPFSETQILSDATQYADGNKNLLTLIDEIKKSTRGGTDSKYGKLGGPFAPPLRIFRSVDAGKTSEHRVSVTMNQYVQVTVDGQGENFRRKDSNGNILSSDLRLMVYDVKGHTIAQDQSVGSNCSVSFIARDSSNLLIEVKNVGRLRDDFVLFIYRK